MQQSAAFKILRTRLKTVPSYSFNAEQLRRTSSGNPYSHIRHNSSGSQLNEDGDLNSEMGSFHSGINFASRLQQFEQMQHQHRMHAKAQAQLRKSSTPSLKVRLALVLFLWGMLLMPNWGLKLGSQFGIGIIRGVN